MIDFNGQCWRATRRQVMSSYGCQVRYLWLAEHVENPYLEGSFFWKLVGVFYLFCLTPDIIWYKLTTYIQPQRLLQGKY